MQVILASSSPYRKKLLERLQIPFECHSPHIDEEKIKEMGISAQEMVEKLSLQKAKKIQEQFPEAIIIASDQMGVIGQEILNKPKTKEKAIKMLESMQGSSHKLLTYFHVLYKDQIFGHLDTTTLSMRTLKHEEIERYVESDKPFDCAGSYKLEQLGISLFEKIETNDASAIEGLPLMALCHFLRELGLKLP